MKFVMLWKRHTTSGCEAISDTSPPDQPVAETPNVRERDEQERAKGRQEEKGPEDEAQLVKMIARLTLQHEFVEANSEIMLPMEASKEAYGAEGEKVRKSSGDQFKGHPEGEKPDAMFRMLASRLAALVEKQKKALDGAVGALMEQYQETTQRALQTVLIMGKQAEKEKDMRAKRCFDVKLQRRQETMHQVDSGSASSSGVHASIERPEANKDTGSCANQGRGGQSDDEQGSQGYQGRSQGRRKRRWLFLRPKETPKEVNRGTSTANQDKMWGGVPGASSQRTTSPWPKLGISHCLQSSNCPSGTHKQSAVGGTLVRIWMIAATCALFSSHQCCTLVGPISGAPMLCSRSEVSRTIFKLVGMSLCCDVIFSRHRRSAASFLDRPDLFLDCDFRLLLSCAS